MSDQEKELNLDLSGGGQKPNTKKLIIIIAVVVLVLGGGGAAFFLTRKPNESSEKSGKQAQTVDASSTVKKAIYLPIKQNFVLSYKQGKKNRYLQAELAFMYREEKLTDILQLHSSVLRSRFIDILSMQDPQELQSPEGKEALKLSLLNATLALLEEENITEPVEQVLFLAFVMQ
jgi:flagellar protein FliL